MARGRKTGGRKPGTPNKVTSAFKAAVLDVYNRMGEVTGKDGTLDEQASKTAEDAFLAWAQGNQTEFYRIAARLIPHEVVGAGDKGEHLIKTVQHIHEK